MRLCDKKIPIVYLKPGEMYITEKPTLVSTVLGSCVSVTMFNPRLKIGAICHGLLPTYKAKLSCRSLMEEYKYVNSSIDNMVKKYKGYGVCSRELEVKIFGGSEMMHAKPDVVPIVSIGIQNVQAAIHTIKSNGLSSIATNVGGASGRKLYFNTQTGDVFMKLLGNKEYR